MFGWDTYKLCRLTSEEMPLYFLCPEIQWKENHFKEINMLLDIKYSSVSPLSPFFYMYIFFLFFYISLELPLLTGLDIKKQEKSETIFPLLFGKPVGCNSVIYT